MIGWWFSIVRRMGFESARGEISNLCCAIYELPLMPGFKKILLTPMEVIAALLGTLAHSDVGQFPV